MLNTCIESLSVSLNPSKDCDYNLAERTLCGYEHKQIFRHFHMPEQLIIIILACDLL